MRGLALVLAVVATGCGSGPQPAAPRVAVATPAPVFTRDPAKDNLPLVADVNLGASSHTFQGGDDHVTLVVQNRGRDIQELLIAAAPWLAEHTFQMGSSRYCQPNPDAGVIDCGPVYAGDARVAILRTSAEHTGTFHYEMQLFDREPGGVLPIADSTGRPLLVAWDELVDPVTSQIPGGRFTPSPAPTPG